MPFKEGHKHGKRFTSEYQPEGRGRPKGSRSASTILKEYLELGVEIELKGKKVVVNGDTLAKELIKIALKGEKEADRIKAIQVVHDRTEGKPIAKQEIKIEAEPDKMTLPDGSEIDI